MRIFIDKFIIINDTAAIRLTFIWGIENFLGKKPLLVISIFQKMYHQISLSLHSLKTFAIKVVTLLMFFYLSNLFVRLFCWIHLLAKILCHWWKGTESKSPSFSMENGVTSGLHFSTLSGILKTLVSINFKTATIKTAMAPSTTALLRVYDFVQSNLQYYFKCL